MVDTSGNRHVSDVNVSPGLQLAYHVRELELWRNAVKATAP